MKTVVVVLAILGLAVLGMLVLQSGGIKSLQEISFHKSVEILEVTVAEPYSHQIRVGVASCNFDPELIHKFESENEVEIKMISSWEPFRGGQDDCQDSVIVRLDRPLGARAVIDKHRGRVVDVVIRDELNQ